MKFIRWVGTILVVIVYFIATNEASIYAMRLYPESTIDPVFLCNSIFSLVSILGIQQIWSVGTVNKKEVLDEEAITEYIYTKEDVKKGLFEAAKELLDNAEEITELLNNARDRDKHLKIILKTEYEKKFRGRRATYKPL